MDYFEPKTIVIAVTAMVFLAVVLDFMRRKKRNRYENLQMSSRELDRGPKIEEDQDPFLQSQFPSGGSRVVGMRNDEFSPTIENERQNSLFRQPEQGSLSLDTEEKNINPEPEKKPDLEQKTSDTSAEKSAAQEVLVIHLMANADHCCSGSSLLDTAVDLGLRYGAMKIFHRHTDEDGSGPILFSMANVLKPGTFDLSTIGELELAGVTLFMTPSDLEKPTVIFDLMMDTAEKLATELDLNIMDESRSSMTKQTIDHYRQRAQQATLLQERSG
jgi:cell division protein ZipA